MLKQRVITALALLVLLLPALFARASWPFAVFALCGIAAAGWEWARLNGAGASAAVALGVALGAACAAALGAGWTGQAPAWAWWMAALLWIVGGLAALRQGPAEWPRVPLVVRCVGGLAALWIAWLAMAHARAIGVNFILSVFCLVWAADIAAYFGGRAWGRRKLAPSISPGKSWEGVWSGLVGALVIAALWLVVDARVATDSTSLYLRLSERFGWAGLALAVVFLALMSVVGDLFESLVKRSAGRKDSSGLLPGHGGVLDRIDALLPLFPIALALVAL